jgi:ureidoacrylate peracid hydrolase
VEAWAMPTDVFSAKRVEAAMTLTASRAAILVIDMLNDFCKPGGAMVLPGYERLIAPQRMVLDAGRRAGAAIIFLTDGHRPNMRREREFLKRTPHCFDGSWGAQIIAELEPGPDDIVVRKRRYSGFFNTDLDLTLKDMEVQSVVVMGVVTNICVRSTVHDAFFLGYGVVVPEDCVAATGPREQESSLFDIATHFGVVCDAAHVVEALLEGTPIVNKITE